MASDNPRRPKRSLPPAVSSRPSSKSGKRKKSSGKPLPGILIAVIGVAALGGIAFAALQFWNKSPVGPEAPAAAVTATPGLAAPSADPAASATAPTASTSGSGWNVRPDPAAAPPSVVLAPLPQDIVTAIGTPTVQRVAGNRALALIEHSPKGGVREFSIWDLGQGKVRGQKVTLDGPAADPTASSDGALLALRPIRRVTSDDPQKREKLSSEQIEIWAVDSGQKLRTIQAGDDQTNLTLTEFIAPRTIATFCYVGFDQKRSMFLRLWNAETGAMLKEIPWNGYFQPNHIAFSPGGRYLATVDGFQPIPPRIFDLESGAVAGAIPLPRENSTGEHFEWVSIAFSPDGARLAALRTSQTETEIAVADCSTGAVLRTHKLAGQIFQIIPSSSIGPGLAWLPDGSGWLIAGGMIFDDASGVPVFIADGRTLPVGMSSVPFRSIIDDRLVYVSQANAGQVDKTTSFRGLTIPWVEIRQPGASLPVTATLE